MVEDSCFDDLDRSFLNISSKMADVFSWTYGMLGYRLVGPLDPNKFDNATSKIKEIAIRAMIVLGALISFTFAGTYIFLTGVILSAGSKVFRAVGFHLQKNGFTHVKGSLPEISLKGGEAKVMTWNIRGYGGGLHYDHGGVVHWRSRIDRIVNSINSESPDVLFLQEVYDTALMEALIDKLGSQYAHFYTHLGPNTWGQESGCMVITKCAVHDFNYTPFKNNDSSVNRGFETLEIKASPTDVTPCARIIGTQLIPDKDSGEKRMKQVAQIVGHLGKQKLSMATLCVGSLHVDRDSRSGNTLSKYLYHSYLDKEPTHSEQLVSQWAPIYRGLKEESSDFISFFKRIAEGKQFPVVEKGIRLQDSHLVEGFDKSYNTKTALSDHHAVVTTFSGLRAAAAGA
jgi:exonuclease III